MLTHSFIRGAGRTGRVGSLTAKARAVQPIIIVVVNGDNNTRQTARNEAPWGFPCKFRVHRTEG